MNILKNNILFETLKFVVKLRKNKCNICNKKSYFSDFNNRKSIRCRHCLSLERQRLFINVYNERIKRDSKVLHFAPENALYDFLSKHFSYYPVDLFPEKYKNIKNVKKEDVTNISFDDNSFDAVIINHVLEHILDDIKALKEIRRVLKKDGIMLMSVPSYCLDKTFEDSIYVSDNERKIMFDQEDHVRKYGRDIIDRLKLSGFSDIENLQPLEIVSKKFFDEYRLNENDNIWICKK